MTRRTGTTALLVAALVIAGGLVGFGLGRYSAPSASAPPPLQGVTASLYARLVAAAAQGAGVDASLTAEGSFAGARQVALVRNTYSLFVSVDPAVIQAILYPNITDWYIALARDRMVLGYSPLSPMAAFLANESARVSAALSAGDSASALNATRDTLDRVFAQDTSFGTTDPNTDPEGYRALMVLQLAGLSFYGDAGHYTGLLEAARAAGRVVTVGAGSQLFSYVQSGQVDVDLPLYASAAQGADIPYVPLAPRVDLGDVNESSFYAQAAVNVTASGSTTTLRGAPIVLAATIPFDAPNPSSAAQIILYLLSAPGRDTMTVMGIPPMSPAAFYGNDAHLPPTLRAVLGSSLLQPGG